MNRRVMLASLLAVSMAGIAAENEEWAITLALDSGRKEFALREPVRIGVSWRNTGTTDQYLKPGRPKLAVGRDGTWQTVDLYETSIEQRRNEGSPLIEVRPQESRERFFWLLLGGPAGTKADFLFGAAGEWHVAWPDQSASVTFRVAEPRDSDRRALALFSREVAAVFLGEMATPADVESLTRIASDHPDSVYAPYVIITLANRERRLGKAEIDKMGEWLENVIRTHPSDVLGEAAHDLSISRAVSEGDYATARDLYDKLKVAFPGSRLIEQLRALEGAPRVKVTLQKPEEEKAVKNDPPESKVPETAPAEKKPEAKPTKVVGQAVLELVNAEKLPEHVRNLLTQYWRACIAEDVAQIRPLLGPDYLHGSMSWAQWEKELRENWAEWNLLGVKVQIQSCDEKNSFKVGRNAHAYVYRGPLLVVTAEVTTKEKLLFSGKEKATRLYWWIAVAQVNDRWLILGDQSESRSWVVFSRASTLSHEMGWWGEISRDLAKSRAVGGAAHTQMLRRYNEIMSRPVVNTKDGVVGMSDLLRKELKIPEESSIEWVYQRHELVGETLDVPLLHGVVITQTEDGREIKTPIGLRFSMKDNALYLEEVVFEGSVTPQQKEK